MKPANIFTDIPGDIPDEFFEDLLQTGSFRVERIVSRVPSLPAGQWYDQENDEWVVLLKGSAGLEFEQSGEVVVMRSGDYLHLPAHTRHRVAWTDPAQETIWLAIHY